VAFGAEASPMPFHAKRSAVPGEELSERSGEAVNKLRKH